MSNSREFVAHAIDLVSLVGPVEPRPMFGGHGLYVRGAMFGLLDDDELFLKTDTDTRDRFVAAGCRPWVYTSKAGRIENTSYFRPPDEAHEDAEAMLPWARLAVEAAERAHAARAVAKKAAQRKRDARKPEPAPEPGSASPRTSARRTGAARKPAARRRERAR